ncbi:unnamed protein product [Linum tenue]|uniref:SWI/SNF complex subunit SWI3B n=1 Tax=Linum tenue TaxID=586396 RepID=A0AAV0LKY5_9ROSI|nr:unnamed protein product [Linum tenue]
MASLEPPAAVTPPSSKPNLLPLPSPTIITPSAAALAAVAPTTSSSSPATLSVATPLPTPSDAELVHIPSYSRWFSLDGISECEIRCLPEFFDSRSPSRNPRAYKYIRDSIIKQFRRNPSSKITFTEVRKTLAADVISIRRVFDFLDAWGLINYSPAALSKPLKWEEKDSKTSQHAADSPAGPSSDSTPPVRETTKWLCGSCKSVCSIACFASDKCDLTLCARCFVRGNYRVGLSSSDFRRVEISDEMKTDWTEKETMQLLEAVMHYGDDWKKVAQHVGGRSEKDCITHFIKLPMGEKLAGSAEFGSGINKLNQMKDDNSSNSSSSGKRLCLSPLADASNPIMAQAAFLSALAGTAVAEAAAQAAVTAVSKVGHGEANAHFRSLHGVQGLQNASITSNGSNKLKSSEEARSGVNTMPEEKVNVEEELRTVAMVQMKHIQEKIIHFEEIDSQIDKEWKQMEQMRDILFYDQLNLLKHERSIRKTGQQAAEGTRAG